MGMVQQLVDVHIEDIVNNHMNIYGAKSPISLSGIGQSSFDIPLGDEVFVMDYEFVPFNKPIRSVVESDALRKIELGTSGAVLHRNNLYLIPVFRSSLPEYVSASLSPKSSIGRIDLFVKSITDYVGKLDEVPYGQSSPETWLMVEPQSFDVRVYSDTPLNQIRFHDTRKPSVVDLDVSELFPRGDYDAKSNILDGHRVSLSIDVSSDLVGYVAKPTSRIVDLKDIGDHAASDFFEPVYANNGSLSLKKDHFYILNTRERIFVDPKYSVHMLENNHKYGEFRAHYAGFFDPGFGDAKSVSERGSVAVLEIRPNVDMRFEHGQPVCDIEFFKNVCLPETSYGLDGTNYRVQQGPRLSKYFTQ